jgi:RNA polymerase sigma-70 factor (ECF subfamily)
MHELRQPPFDVPDATPAPAVAIVARPAAPSIVTRETTNVLDETTLCANAMRGDMSAWNVLVQKHNHRVVVSLLARGVRIDRAKDIAQDAWMRLIEQQREGRLTHLALPGLAITQAGFLALEAARRARRTDPVDVEPETIGVADPSASAEAKLLTEEQLARAQKVLARCSPSARKVFQLAYGEEALGHAEVAAKVGLSLQRVRQIVCEVRKELRASIDDGEGVGS